jgi:zinc protease
MRRPRPFSLLAAIAVGLIPGLPCLSPARLVPPQAPSSPPTVEQILANYNRALGGEENYHKLKTRVMKAVIHTAGSGEAGSIEAYQAAPDRGMSSTYFPGDKPMVRGYDGAKGWVVDPDEGPQEAAGDDLAAIKREFDFYRALRLKETYPQMTYSGTETLGNRKVFVTESKSADGGSEKFYFDAQTGLLLRHDVPVPDSGGVRQMTYSDYRNVDGVQYPFKVQISDPDSEFVIEYTEIRHNEPIDVSKFAMPAK